MKALGKVFKYGDNVDTDVIIPARYLNSSDCLEKIGANVKFLRTMRKLRQQDVAQTLGISQTHLSNMECGRVKFSLKQLLRLANLFDCQLECFFDPRQAANVAVGGTGQDKRYTQSDMELLLTLVKKSGQP